MRERMPRSGQVQANRPGSPGLTAAGLIWCTLACSLGTGCSQADLPTLALPWPQLLQTEHANGPFITCCAEEPEAGNWRILALVIQDEQGNELARRDLPPPTRDADGQVERRFPRLTVPMPAGATRLSAWIRYEPAGAPGTSAGVGRHYQVVPTPLGPWLAASEVEPTSQAGASVSALTLSLGLELGVADLPDGPSVTLWVAAGESPEAYVRELALVDERGRALARRSFPPPESNPDGGAARRFPRISAPLPPDAQRVVAQVVSGAPLSNGDDWPITSSRAYEVVRTATGVGLIPDR